MKENVHISQEENNQEKNVLEEEPEVYGDPDIASCDAKIPKFLYLTYFLLPLWGVVTLYYFWNGSLGWLDRGYWHELQIAANTTFPVKNKHLVLEKKELEEENEALSQ